ncbi:MAG: PilW family protein [Pseudomonadales bacterium]
MQVINRRRSSGFSLVELLLALVLGLVVVTGIVQLFVGNSRTYNVLNGQARMQENARFALEFITQAARSTGFFGCSLDRTNYVNGLGGEWQNIPDREWDITQIIQADAGWVRFRSTRRPAQRVVQVTQPDENPTVVAPGGDPGFAVGDIVVLSSCEQGAVFRVTGMNTAGNEAELLHRPGGVCNGLGSGYTAVGNAVCVVGIEGFVPYTLSKLSRSYGADSTVAALDNTTFFVAPGADGNDALWQDVNGTANELVSGVEDLQVLFGIDDDLGDGVTRVAQYVDFGNLPDPNDLSNVVALRISITVNSVDEVTDDGNVLRRTYAKTIQMRNSNPEA